MTGACVRPGGPATAPTPGTALVVAGVHKAFGAHPVLTGIDLRVPEGAFAAVLGPSGSGKTTLLRILAGFERPDLGRVTLGPTVVDDGRRHVPPERRGIGYVAQEGSLFPHLSVEANVGFGLDRRHRRGPRVGELLDAVGLGDLGGRYPHQLSGGQQQRVALARALAVEPRVVLLDEPFAALDANLRASVRADVAAILRTAGATAVLVTHDQDEALSMADLVAVIRSGTIAQMAPPQDLYARPVDADLARFVGETNLLDGVAAGGVARTALGSLTLGDDEPDGPVTVLVRPEQIELRPGRHGPGAAGRVLRYDFHGHDVVVRVAVDGAGGSILARVLGHSRLEPGAAVTLAVTGPARSWPAPEAAAGDAVAPTAGGVAAGS